MVTIPLRPKHGGFLRAVSLGLFIRDYLMGKSPFDTPKIDPNKGSYQSDIFYQYKMALIGSFVRIDLRGRRVIFP